MSIETTENLARDIYLRSFGYSNGLWAARTTPDSAFDYAREFEAAAAKIRREARKLAPVVCPVEEPTR